MSAVEVRPAKKGPAPGKRLAAVFCLLAVSLLHVPMALAAWSIEAGLCCTGDYCPILAHHHHQTPAAPAAGKMDCGHDMGDHEQRGMSKCNMSCCHDSGGPAIASVAYVLPLVVSEEGLPPAYSPVMLAKQTSSFPKTKPLSPPPRFRSLAD
jgi:hypothetical protein